MSLHGHPLGSELKLTLCFYLFPALDVCQKSNLKHWNAYNMVKDVVLDMLYRRWLKQEDLLTEWRTVSKKTKYQN